MSRANLPLDQILTPATPAADATGAGVCRLSGYASFRVGGADARDFLSRQLSCDVAMLDATRSVHGAWLSAKGRVLALVRLVEHDGGIVMLLDQSVANAAVARMKMFVLRSDVLIEPAPELRVAGLMHASATDAPTPAKQDEGQPGLGLAWHGITLIWLGRNDTRVLMLGAEAALATACASLLEHGAQVVDETRWDQLEVDAGVARLDAANADAFVPQMLNLDRTEGISFNKGCYPGQEIVARTQHLGRIKRRMFKARLGAGGEGVAPGTSVHGARAPDMAVGRVVRIVPDSSGGNTVLAVIALDSVRSAEALDAGGIALEDVSEPPYGLGADAD